MTPLNQKRKRSNKKWSTFASWHLKSDNEVPSASNSSCDDYYNNNDDDDDNDDALL